MRKIIFILFIFAPAFIAFAFETGLPPLNQSKAYQQWSHQPKSELATLLYLLNRFTESPAKVVYDNVEYESAEASRLARNYLLKHYHKESADYWIKKYCYKTDAGNLVLFKSADGSTRPARDVVLEDLEVLNKKAASS